MDKKYELPLIVAGVLLLISQKTEAKEVKATEHKTTMPKYKTPKGIRLPLKKKVNVVIPPNSYVVGYVDGKVCVGSNYYKDGLQFGYHSPSKEDFGADIVVKLTDSIYDYPTLSDYKYIASYLYTNTDKYRIYWKLKKIGKRKYLNPCPNYILNQPTWLGWVNPRWSNYYYCIEGSICKEIFINSPKGKKCGYLTFLLVNKYNMPLKGYIFTS